MNLLKFLSKSRSTRNLISRISSVLGRFSISAKKGETLLNRYSETTRHLGCVPTFPVPAVTMKRHPRLIRDLHDRGIEFAVHGYIHIDYGVLEPAEQEKHFQKAITTFRDNKIPFTGFRAPFLRINNETLPVLSRLKFAYDSSHAINWEVLDREKFPAQSWESYNRLIDFYQPYPDRDFLALPRAVDGIIEIPVSIPDDEAMVERLRITDTQEISRIWMHILEETHKRGELFTVQLHPERIMIFENALTEVILRAKTLEPSVWITTLGEITGWWQEKNEFNFNISPEDAGRFTVEANCSDRATVLFRNCRVDKDIVTGELGGYQVTPARRFVLESFVRPVIGVSPDTAASAVDFLKSEGYAVEQTTGPENCGIYLNTLSRFSAADEKPLSRKIEQSGAPLLRYWRWPERNKSALSVTGDLDSITLVDFVLRIFENWQQNRKKH
jgi:peptidoglycan/xylan/chitin deacetylase (PgdA/CDA1 family)